MRILFIILALFFPMAVQATELGTPVTYLRGTLALRSQNAPTADGLLPWQTPPDTSAKFDVEIRDGMSLYNQDGWYNLSSYGDHSGLLLLFENEGTQPITRSAQYAAIDILLIDKEGTIAQILPSIVLSQLSADLYPKQPVLAFLLVKGGTAQALNIQPGDIVDYKAFKRPQTVLSTPKYPPAPAPNPTPPVTNIIQAPEFVPVPPKPSPVLTQIPDNQRKIH
jgi:uncharacterized membrane protein (UPF0127 family)